MTSTQSAREAGAAQGVVLLLLALFPIMGLTTLTPALPRMLEHFKDVPNADVLVPTAATLPYLAIALFSPLFGAIGDRYGRRNVILVAAAIYSITGTAPLFLESLPAIMASRFAVGISEAAIQALSLALIGDYFKGERRTMWLTLQPPVVTLAAAGLGIATGLLTEISWRAPFALYGVTILMFIAVWLFIWEPEREVAPAQARNAKAKAFPWRITLWIAAVSFSSAVVMIAGPVQFGFVLQRAGVDSPSIVGYCLAASSLIGVPAGSYLYSRISKARIPALTAIAFAAGGLGLFGLTQTTDVYLLTAWLTAVQAGFGFLMPTLANWAMQPLSYEQRGRGMGIWSMALFGGEFVGPLAVAPMNHVTGGLLPTLAIFGIGLCASAALSLLLLFRARRPAPAAA